MKALEFAQRLLDCHDAEVTVRIGGRLGKEFGIDSIDDREYKQEITKTKEIYIDIS